MGALALAPAVACFPIVLCLTYFLGVTPRRALVLTLAGAIPLALVGFWLDGGDAHGRCGTSCLGLRDAAPVAWWLMLAWILAVGAGTALGVWRERVDARVTTSRAGAAQRGA